MPSPATLPLLVVLASAWGPKHGGINAFNIEWCKSLGIVPHRHFDLICVCLNVTPEERADAQTCHVDLRGLDVGGQDMGAGLATKVQDALKVELSATPKARPVVWIGHDYQVVPAKPTKPISSNGLRAIPNGQNCQL